MDNGLPNLQAMTLEGPDAGSFLQGYLTADLDRLDADEGLPMAWCTLKGRVLANGWAAGSPEVVTLVVDASVADRLEHEMSKYLLFSRSRLNRESTPATAFSLPPTGCRWDDADGNAFAAACVESGVVIVRDVTSDAFLPQMIGLVDIGAVSFAKGCYLGQEIVARAQHRGQVKVKLRRYRLTGDGSPEIGEDVLDGAAKAGTVVEVAPGGVLAATRTDAASLRGAGGAGLALQG